MYLYCILYQGLDQEEYGGAWELLKEGMMTAFAMFLVSLSWSKLNVLTLYKHYYFVTFKELVLYF